MNEKKVTTLVFVCSDAADVGELTDCVTDKAVETLGTSGEPGKTCPQYGMVDAGETVRGTGDKKEYL